MKMSVHRLVTVMAATAPLLVAGCDSTPTSCPGGDIQSVDLAVGSGPPANDSSRVRLTSTGTLEDGTQIFSDVNQTVTLSETFPIGFRQGVAGMRANGRRRFTLPPNLGFGPEGYGAQVPACARLTFTVELHEILAQGCGNAAPNVTIEDPVLGSGLEATGTSQVTVNSTLSLQDGTVVETRTAHTFVLTDPNLIEGIRRGILGMREGGVRRVFIPPNFGYGVGGSSPSIPSCAALIYDVELVAVVP